MMCCRPSDSMMMRYQGVGIPPGVLSLADEVFKLHTLNHMGRVQEDKQQLP